jgi:poly-gamma-glutamate synthesis protein (capsule biosynthesis protein)
LDDAQLIYFGDVGIDQARQRFYLMQVLNEKIALISYNQFTKEAKSNALEDIEEAKRKGASLILLFSHWGNEYVPVANQIFVDLAHEFIDKGVDLIVGGHPHVIQNKEIYQDKSIYYSLGNFVFDQYFSHETQEGLLLKINFTYNPYSENWTYEIDEYHVYMNRDGVSSFKKNTD